MDEARERKAKLMPSDWVLPERQYKLFPHQVDDDRKEVHPASHSNAPLSVQKYRTPCDRVLLRLINGSLSTNKGLNELKDLPLILQYLYRGLYSKITYLLRMDEYN